MDIYNKVPDVVQRKIDEYLRYDHKQKLHSQEFHFILDQVKYLVDNDIPLYDEEDPDEPMLIFLFDLYFNVLGELPFSYD